MCIGEEHQQQGNISPFPMVRPTNPKGVHLGHSNLIIIHILGTAFGELFTPPSLSRRSKENTDTKTRQVQSDDRTHNSYLYLLGNFPVCGMVTNHDQHDWMTHFRNRLATIHRSKKRVLVDCRYCRARSSANREIWSCRDDFPFLVLKARKVLKHLTAAQLLSCGGSVGGGVGEGRPFLRSSNRTEPNTLNLIHRWKTRRWIRFVFRSAHLFHSLVHRCTPTTHFHCSSSFG